MWLMGLFVELAMSLAKCCSDIGDVTAFPSMLFGKHAPHFLQTIIIISFLMMPFKNSILLFTR